jgi:PhnB protein
VPRRVDHASDRADDRRPGARCGTSSLAERDNVGMTSIAGWLTVSDGSAAVDFYRAALGAVDTYRFDDNGAIIVARLRVGDSEFWIQAEPDHDPGEPSIRMIVTVDDPDTWLRRSVAAGAVVVAEVHDEHGWRTGRVRDPFGHHWEFSRELDGDDSRP